MQIELDPRLFNPLYFEVKKDLENPDIRFIWVYGGSSASKTFSLAQAFTVESLEGKSTMIFRKAATELRDSVYKDCKGIAMDWLPQIFDPKINIIENTINSAVLRFRGMDDSEKVKGIAQFSYVWLEEVTAFDYSDFKQVRKRLRGMKNQKIIGSFNPIDENHWIKAEVFDKDIWHKVESNVTEKFVNEKGNAVIYRVTYKDNYWITGSPCGTYGFVDKHTIDDFEHDRIHDYNYYRVYGEGHWGKLDIGAEFYKSFNIEANVKTREYNPEERLFLSFDENVNPYFPCSVWQIDGEDYYCIDEIAMKAPQNTVQNMATEVYKRYRDHQADIHIHGDATSRKKDVKTEQGYNFFTLIKNELTKHFDPSKIVIKTPQSNPSTLLRGLFINSCFALKQNIRIFVADSCKLMIMDLKYTKEASDGKKLKEKERDGQTKVTFERYGHFSDTLDYLVCEVAKSEFRAFSRSGRARKKLDMIPKSVIKY